VSKLGRSRWALLGVVVLVLALGGLPMARAQTASPTLLFDGRSSYVEAPASAVDSVTGTGALTVAVWIRPDTLTFADTEGSGYVYFLGKGEPGNYEWAFRIYSSDNSEGRGNRISFYLFNPGGGLGAGAYAQDTLTPGGWTFIAATVDGEHIHLYKDGVARGCENYLRSGDPGCPHDDNLTITPVAGDAPLRIGTRDFHSYFQGAISQARLWNRPLSGDEIATLYSTGAVPPDGLVAEYLLSEGAGNVAYDTAGGNDGAISSVTWENGNDSVGSSSSVGRASRWTSLSMLIRRSWTTTRDRGRACTICSRGCAPMATRSIYGRRWDCAGRSSRRSGWRPTSPAATTNRATGTRRCSRLGIPVRPDFCVDDQDHAVAIFGGVIVSRYERPDPADRELERVYAAVGALVQDRSLRTVQR
jgi:hypothetical protein